MHASPQSRVSPTVLSSALIGFSSLWFVSAWVFHVSNRYSKDGVSGAPLWALLFLVLVPLSNFVLVPWLLKARRADCQQLRAFDYCALLAGVAPFAFVGVLILIVIASR